MTDEAKGRRFAFWPGKSIPVPPKDHPRNDYTEDVAGNKTDVAITSPSAYASLVAYAKGGLNQLANILGLIGKEYDLSKNEVTWSDVDGRVVFTAGISHKDSGYVPSADIFPGCITLLQYRGDAEPTQILGEEEVEDEEFVGDGETVAFTLAYNPTTSISEVTIDGEPTVDYTFNMITGVITFGTAPANEAVILVTYFYGLICSKANGRIYYPYTFGDGVWITDDQFYVRIDYAHITIGGTIYYLPPMEWMGTIQDTSTIVGMLDTIDSLCETIDGKADVIQERTDNLPDDPADESAVEGAITAAHLITDGAIATHDSDIKALLGTPVGDDLSADIAAIPVNPMLDTEDGSSFTAIPDMAKDSTVAKEATLGAPVGASISDDISAVGQTVDDIINNVAGIITTLGTPVSDISQDIAAVKSDTAGIATIPTNPMLDTEDGSSFSAIPDMAKDSTVAKEATLGTPVGADLSADIAAIPINPMLDTEDGSSLTAIPDMAKDSTVAKEATLGAPVGASLSADIAAIPINPILDTEDGSSFSAIPDMAKDSTVAKEATLTLVGLAAKAITHELRVDNGRTDTYTADGSIDRPYKTIQAAIDYAVTQTPSATHIFQVKTQSGFYDEAITMASYVYLKGNGTRGSTIIFQDAANVITLADHVEIENLTVRTGTGDQLACFVDNAVACNVKLINVVLESLYASTSGWTGLYITGAGEYTLDKCYSHTTATNGGLGDSGVVLIEAVPAKVKLINNDFYMAGAAGPPTSSKSIIGIIGPAACEIISHGNTYDGDEYCNMIYGEDGTIYTNDDVILTKYADQIVPSCTVVRDFYPVEDIVTDDWNAAEADIVSLGQTASLNKVHSLLIDLSALTVGATITLRMYEKVNGSEKLLQPTPLTFVVSASMGAIPLLDGTFGIHDVLRITAQSDNALDDGKDINYSAVVERMS